MTGTAAPSTVSVVIPVRDGAAFLAEAIQSARSQTRPPLEVIVVDDGSRDSSAEIARASEGVKLISIKPGGQAQARNLGAARAAGDLIAFLDADDLWAADKLALQIAALTADPVVDAVFAHAIEFRGRDQDGRILPVGPPMPAHVAGAMVIRREAFERLCGYRQAGQVAELVEWYARANDEGLVMRTLGDVLLMRRLHAGNIGRIATNPRGDYLRTLREVIRRRRTAAGSTAPSIR